MHYLMQIQINKHGIFQNGFKMFNHNGKTVLYYRHDNSQRDNTGLAEVDLYLHVAYFIPFVP